MLTSVLPQQQQGQKKYEYLEHLLHPHCVGLVMCAEQERTGGEDHRISHTHFIDQSGQVAAEQYCGEETDADAD